MKKVFTSSKLLFISVFLLAISATTQAQNKQHLYVYNLGLDTLYFEALSEVRFDLTTTPIDAKLIIETRASYESDAFFGKNNCEVIDSFQLDGKGKKEMLFRRTCATHFPMHGGTFDGLDVKTIEQVELWNLDTKEMYWRGVVFYDHSSVGSYNSDRRDVFQFQYHFDAVGTLTIRKEYAQSTHTDSIAFGGKSTCLAIIPELKEGVYQWIEGRFQNVD